MGFFDRFFKKKICALCGAEIKLFGNRKVEDGNMCKECADKLSPWFDERRSSTVAEINEQLIYREENREKLRNFNVTLTLGGDIKKMIIDEKAGQFVITSARHLVEDNPDIIEYSMVTGCNMEINDHHTEVKRRDKDGKMVSYEPPRYRYFYDFYVVLNVNHRFFDEMRFRLNTSSVETTTENGAHENKIPNPKFVNEYVEYQKKGEEIIRFLSEIREKNADIAVTKQD